MSTTTPPVGPDQLAHLAELIPQLVWITDPTGSHTYFNQRWIDYTGYTVADSVGPDMWNNLLHPDDRQRARTRWGHSLATGEFYEIEYRFLSKEGTYHWFLGQALPQRDAQGTIQQWFGTCTYIDDAKRAQLALERVTQDFVTLADTMPQLTWMSDPAGHVFWYNQRWHAYTGTTPATASPEQWQAAYHPAHWPRVAEKLRQGVATGEAWEDTLLLRGHDGTYRWFLARTVPVRDAEGQVVRWCSANTDITEQKELHIQLEHAFADLEVKVTFRNLELEREVQTLRQQLAGQ